MFVSARDKARFETFQEEFIKAFMQGSRQGFKEGRQEEKQEMGAKFKALVVDMATIAEATSLSTKQIESL